MSSETVWGLGVKAVHGSDLSEQAILSNAFEVGGTSFVMGALEKWQDHALSNYEDVNGHQVDTRIDSNNFWGATGQVVAYSAVQSVFDIGNQWIVGSMRNMSVRDITDGIQATMGTNFLHNVSRNMRKHQVYRSAQDAGANNLLACQNSFDGWCLAGERKTKNPDGTYTPGKGEFGGDQGSPDKTSLFRNYNANGDGFLDRIYSRIYEQFAGPHDFFNDPFYYNEMGSTNPNHGYGDWPNYSNLIWSLPFVEESMFDKWTRYNWETRENK